MLMRILEPDELMWEGVQIGLTPELPRACGIGMSTLRELPLRLTRVFLHAWAAKEHETWLTQVDTKVIFTWQSPR